MKVLKFYSREMVFKWVLTCEESHQFIVCVSTFGVEWLFQQPDLEVISLVQAYWTWILRQRRRVLVQNPWHPTRRVALSSSFEHWETFERGY